MISHCGSGTSAGERSSRCLIKEHLNKDINFVSFLKDLLASEPNIPPESLELETLETCAFGDLIHATDIVDQCKALGVTVSIDDFGTGYSSLTYLKRLAVDTIKIDKSFVMNMSDDEGEKAIVVGILGLCKAFNKKVVAEGVDNLALIDKLIEMGCHVGQGYAIAKPMDPEKIPQWQFNPTREDVA